MAVLNGELRALIEQAGRNLDTLELLFHSSDLSGVEQATVASYRARLRALQLAYRRETDHLTGMVLQEALERRSGHDRRQGDRRRPLGSPLPRG